MVWTTAHHSWTSAGSAGDKAACSLRAAQPSAGQEFSDKDINLLGGRPLERGHSGKSALSI